MAHIGCAMDTYTLKLESKAFMVAFLGNFESAPPRLILREIETLLLVLKHRLSRVLAGGVRPSLPLSTGVWTKSQNTLRRTPLCRQMWRRFQSASSEP